MWAASLCVGHMLFGPFPDSTRNLIYSGLIPAFVSPVDLYSLTLSFSDLGVLVDLAAVTECRELGGYN